MGAEMQKSETTEKTSEKKAADKDNEGDEQTKFKVEQRKVALLLDCMGDVRMEIFETWDVEVSKMQYGSLREAFDNHFASKEGNYRSDPVQAFYSRTEPGETSTGISKG